jgi:hypothetical protein
MIRYARTYGSNFFPENINQTWQFPTDPAPDNFGVPVPESNITFGLEEFNFNPYFLKEKIAYIPCFATVRTYPRQNLKELKLIYKTAGRCHMHCATLYHVTQILNENINSHRNWINPMMNEIYLNKKSQDFFGDDFEQFAKIINQMKDSNVIASNHNHSPFLINVRYQEIEILKKGIPCEVNPNNVNQWKINVDSPGNCGI